jgi:hypothetical protein
VTAALVPEVAEARDHVRGSLGAHSYWRGEQMTDVCAHLDMVQLTPLPESVPGCEDCLRIGGQWVHSTPLSHLRARRLL